MVSRNIHRRTLLASMAAASLLPGLARAEDYVDLDWEDLLPENPASISNRIPNDMRALLEHDEDMPLFAQQPVSSGVRGDWNGQIVRIPGFIVPIDYSGTGVSAFLLVPYVGACVHVPPPPANQLVFVTAPTPYESDGLFEAVNVTGMFGVSSISTALADVGYALSADKIEPFRS